MFVKKSWNTKAKKRHYQYHIAESYRDKETGLCHRNCVRLYGKNNYSEIEIVNTSFETAKVLQDLSLLKSIALCSRHDSIISLSIAPVDKSFGTSLAEPGLSKLILFFELNSRNFSNSFLPAGVPSHSFRTAGGQHNSEIIEKT